MDAGDHPGELDTLLDAVAGDLTQVRELIAELSRQEADALLLAAVLRVASYEAAFNLIAGGDEP